MKKNKKCLTAAVLAAMCLTTGCSGHLMTEKEAIENVNHGKEWEIVKNEAYSKEMDSFRKYLGTIDGSGAEIYDYKHELYSEVIGNDDYWRIQGSKVINLRDELKKLGYVRTVSAINKMLEVSNGEIRLVENGVEFLVFVNQNDISVDVTLHRSNEYTVKPFTYFQQKCCFNSYHLGAVSYTEHMSEIELVQSISKESGYKKIKVFFDDIDKSDIPSKVETYISSGSKENKVFDVQENKDFLELLKYMGVDEKDGINAMNQWNNLKNGDTGKIKGKNDISWQMEKVKDKMFKLIIKK